MAPHITKIGAGDYVSLPGVGAGNLYIANYVDDNQIHCLTDSGWQTKSVPTTYTGGVADSFENIDVNGNLVLLYAESTFKLIYSEDGGNSWVNINGPTFANSTSIQLVNDIMVLGPNTFLIGVFGSVNASDGGVWKTSNNGSSWTKVVPGLSYDGGTLTAQGGNRFELSGSYLWVPQYHDPSGIGPSSHPFDLYDPASYSQVGDATSSAAFGEEYGDSWIRVYRRLGENAAWMTFGTTSSRGVSGGPIDYEIFKILPDGSYQGFRLEGGSVSSAYEPYGIVDFGNDIIIAYSPNDGVLHRSTNGGVNWTRILDNSVLYRNQNFFFGDVLAKDASSDGVAYIGIGNAANGSAKVFKTIDAGLTWSDTSCPTSGQNVYAMSSG